MPTYDNLPFRSALSPATTLSFCRYVFSCVVYFAVKGACLPFSAVDDYTQPAIQTTAACCICIRPPVTLRHPVLGNQRLRNHSGMISHLHTYHTSAIFLCETPGSGEKRNIARRMDLLSDCCIWTSGLCTFQFMH